MTCSTPNLAVATQVPIKANATLMGVVDLREMPSASGQLICFPAMKTSSNQDVKP